MIENAKMSGMPEFRALVGDDFHGNVNASHLLSKLACNPPVPQCLLNECPNCGKADALHLELAEIFESLDIDEVSYKSWVSVDRTNLETVTKSTDEFIASLIEPEATPATCLHCKAAIIFYE